MECNVGGMDRGLRGVVALAALSTTLCGKTDERLRIAAGVIGAMASFTFLTRYCPLNQLIGLNTCKPGTKGETNADIRTVSYAGDRPAFVPDRR